MPQSSEPCVATVLARKGARGIDVATAAALSRVLPGAGASVWLDPGLALDIPFLGGLPDLPAHRAALRTLLGDAPVDLVVQPVAGRRKRLLLADMDSTVIHQECIDELADFAGLKADASSRVLTADGQPVPGLYVAGSDQANVMGGHYPSGGINIGPAMTFGYIAGRHAAGVTDYED